MDHYLIFSLLYVLTYCFVVDAQELRIYTESPLKAQIGSQHMIECEVTGIAANENPKLWWMDAEGKNVSNSGKIFTSKAGNALLSLTLTDVQENYAGTYTCIALINGQNVTKEFSVETIQGITKGECPSKQYPVAGSDAEIKCVVTGGTVGFRTYWTFGNNSQIQAGDNKRLTPQSNKLIIRNISEADNGLYKLNAYLRGIAFEVFDITVNVTIPPRIKKPPVLSTAIEGKPFQIVCEAEGKPKPEYQWFKDDGSLPLERPRYIVGRTNGSLRIEAVTVDDEGTYRCEARNRGGSARAEAELDVIVPPQIVKLENITENEGQLARLVCEATGDPAPTMTWQQEGTGSPYAIGPQSDNGDITVISNQDQQNQRTELILEIRNLKASNAANYKCTAQNNGGNVHKTGKITVRFLPNFDKQPYRQTYGWHGFRNITCIANGEPEPLISWYKKGSPEEITSLTSFYKVLETPGVKQLKSTLKVQVDYSNDNEKGVFGDYVCRAANSLGRSNVTITFKQAAPPGKPTVTMPMNTPRTVEFLVTEPSSVAGPPVEKFIVKYFPTGKEVEEKTKEKEKSGSHTDNQPLPKTTIIIDGLEPETEYTFLVYAENPVGAGTPERKFHRTAAVRVPYGVEIKSPKDGVKVQSYRLQWKTPNDGGSTLISYSLRYQEVSVKHNKTIEGDYIRDEPLSGPKEISNISPTLNVYTITNLDPNRWYEVELLAINNQGQSNPMPFIFKTAEVPPAGYVGDVAVSVYASSTVAVIASLFACLQAFLL